MSTYKKLLKTAMDHGSDEFSKEQIGLANFCLDQIINAAKNIEKTRSEYPSWGYVEGCVYGEWWDEVEDIGKAIDGLIATISKEK